MKIVIDGNHHAKLTEVLDYVQRRCRARTLCVETVEKILEFNTMKLGISKKALAGTKLLYTGAQQFPSAYRHRPESTHFSAEYNGRFWVVTDVYRYYCPNRHNDTTLTLSDSAKDAALARLAEVRSLCW